MEIALDWCHPGSNSLVGLPYWQQISMVTNEYSLPDITDQLLNIHRLLLKLRCRESHYLQALVSVWRLHLKIFPEFVFVSVFVSISVFVSEQVQYS